MYQSTEYPKLFWVMTRAEVIVEDGKEVINHGNECVIGGTFDSNIAEKMAAVLKENQGVSTMIRSEVLLNAIPTQTEANVQKLLDMVDL